MCAQTGGTLPPTGIEVAAIACVAPHLQLAPSTQRVAGDLVVETGRFVHTLSYTASSLHTRPSPVRQRAALPGPSLTQGRAGKAGQAAAGLGGARQDKTGIDIQGKDRACKRELDRTALGMS